MYSINSTKFLHDPELNHLRVTLCRNKDSDFRNTILLQMALETGARASELLALKKSDINYTDRTILIYGLKGSHDRELPLRLELFNRLKRLVSETEGESVFPIGYHRLRDIWNFYRPGRKPFHSLRHTFAIKLYSKHRDLRLVQVALGHRNITNTMVYADYIFSKQELRKILD